MRHQQVSASINSTLRRQLYMKDKIIRYEKARQIVKELTEKRSFLISQCEYLDTCDDIRGLTVEIGRPCGIEAWECMTDSGNDEGNFCDFEYAFSDEIRDEQGACDNCLEAYKIKHNDLASAKKEFGNAKRSLSYLGKKLIRECI